MEFVNISEKEFDTFAITNNLSNFHQTSLWGNLMTNNGWKTHFVGVRKDNNIIAASLLLEKNIFGKYTIFYALRGYLIDFNDYELINFFTINLKKYVKKHNAMIVKLDPYLIYKERDINGGEVPNGINNSTVVSILEQLGYRHKGFNLKYENMQPRWGFAVNIKNKTKEDVLSNMESTTRRHIKKNETDNVIVREIEKNELEKFKDIMSHTSERREFSDKPLEFYKDMLTELNGMAKIYLAEVNLRELVDKNNLVMKDNIRILEEKEQEVKNNKDVGVKTKRKILDCQNEIQKLEKNNAYYNEIIESDGEVITLGGMVFMIYNKEILSLFGGAYDKYMKFTPFVTLHWEMLKTAIDMNMDKYNLYGIAGTFNNVEDDLYGLYEFKKGFGGHVEEYIGEFDLVVNKPIYYIYSAFRRIKNAIRKKN